MNNKTFSDKYAVPVIVFGVLLLMYLVYLASLKSVKTDEIVSPLASNTTPFSHAELSAKSAIVWDTKDHRALYEYNADTVLPLASLAKIMMGVTAETLVPDYTVVTIKQEFLNEEGDSGLVLDEHWRLKDLLDFSLVASSNDGARAIASVAGAIIGKSSSYDIGRKEFISRMNEIAQEIGLDTMVFTNESGLDTDEFHGGAYGSARDVAKLFEYTLKKHPSLIESTKQSSYVVKSLSNNVHKVNNTNAGVDKIPGVIASKTGYTPLAQGNLAVVFDPELGRPLIISVLGSTFDGRFTDVEKLIAATRTYLEQEAAAKTGNSAKAGMKK